MSGTARGPGGSACLGSHLAGFLLTPEVSLAFPRKVAVQFQLHGASARLFPSAQVTGIPLLAVQVPSAAVSLGAGDALAMATGLSDECEHTEPPSAGQESTARVASTYITVLLQRFGALPGHATCMLGSVVAGTRPVSTRK